MKIAVTSQNFRTVTGHAGRARRFLVYEAGPEGDPVEVDRLDLPKELAMHDFHGSGPHPVDAFDVILSGGFGEGFARRLTARGVAAAVTAETDPVAAVKAWLAIPPRRQERRAAAMIITTSTRMGTGTGTGTRMCMGMGMGMGMGAPTIRRSHRVRPRRQTMPEKQDIGTVESLRIDVLSETGWFDDARFKADMAAGGGSEQSQYKIAWDAENAGGYAALLTLTLADGEVRRILLDTGWHTTWMDHVFARHGVDAMLKRGEIDAMVLSHWHLDHFWGIESTLKHNPKIRIYAPVSWRAEDRALLCEKAAFSAEDAEGRRVPICANNVAHEGS